jgi:type II secretion system protein N
MARRWGTIAGLGIGGGLLFVIFVIFFTPAGGVQGLLERVLEDAGYTFRAGEFGKAFPIGFKARKVEIGDHRGLLFKADEAAVRLRLLPLVTGKLSFGCRAGIGGGKVTGGLSLNRGGEMDFQISRVRMEDIPFFSTAAGTRARGELNAEGSFRGRGSKAAGEARVEIRGVELAGIRIGEMPLPDATYDLARGAMKVSAGRAVIESASLQGEGIYVRLRGDFPVTEPIGAAPLNVTLELMPKPDFLEKQKLVFLLLARYLVSPGNYRIPVSGTLAHPAIQ